ncbi:MAG: hypothetical protein ABIH99_00435 [Candidatus Micrarchaeota archaeon]
MVKAQIVCRSHPACGKLTVPDALARFHKRNVSLIPIPLLKRYLLDSNIPMELKSRQLPALSGTLLVYASSSTVLSTPTFECKNPKTGFSRVVDGLPKTDSSEPIVFAVHPVIVKNNEPKLGKTGEFTWQYDVHMEHSKKRVVFTLSKDAHVIIHPLATCTGASHEESGLPTDSSYSFLGSVQLSTNPTKASFIGLPTVNFNPGSGTVLIDASYGANLPFGAIVLERV